MRLILLTKLFFSPLICADQFNLSSISTPKSRLCVTRSRMLFPRYMGGWGPVKDPLWISMYQLISSGAGSANFSQTTHTTRLGIDLAQQRPRLCSSLCSRWSYHQRTYGWSQTELTPRDRLCREQMEWDPGHFLVVHRKTPSKIWIVARLGPCTAA